MSDVTVVADEGDLVAADFADWCARPSGTTAGGLVVFQRDGRTSAQTLDRLVTRCKQGRVSRVCFVTGHRAHFGGPAEANLTEPLRRTGVTVTVIRSAPVLSPRSAATRWLRLLAPWYPLVPRRCRGCCVDGPELFAVIEKQMAGGRPGVYTLLGPNYAWRDRLAGRRQPTVSATALTWLAYALSLLQLGQLAGLLFSLVARWSQRLRSLCFDTLRPASNRELLELYNPHNYQHIKIVGYNNGVIHFGQKHPGRTVVTTAGCGRVVRLRGKRLTCDGGVTVRRAADALAAAGKEFFVVPNYSYVSLATTFFVPVHGSASDVTTLGDTIEKVLLYDPAADRIIAACRGDLTFGEAMYDLKRDLVLLRLTFRVRGKADYFLRRRTLEGATGGDVLGAFADPRASNVEVRKSAGAARTVEIFQYYCETPEDAAAVPFPRDALGRLWDRLEENRVTAALFHGLVRRLGHHVELFLTPEEFGVFWETHAQLPVRKIQLRYIKRDGLPHSPFRDGDRVSADLFMLKRHRPAFERYLRDHFRAVACNPGKHSA